MTVLGIILSILLFIALLIIYQTYKDKKIIKVPVIKTGTMVYIKDDPDKNPI
jgi:hypothetical protein